MIKHSVIIDKDTCIGCGLCSKVCVTKNIKIDLKKADIIQDECLFCGQCSAVCPQKAISISGYHDDVIEKTQNAQLNPEELLDVIRYRRSIRQFKHKDIEEAIIRQILEAGRLTHTAKNMRDVSFVVLNKEKETIEAMAINLFKKVKPIANIVQPMAKRFKIEKGFFFFHAPIVIVVLAKNNTNGLLAAQNMEFVAEANGLGVLFSGYFTTAANVSFKIKKALKIPKGKHVAMTLVLGYPNIRYLRSTPHEKLNATFL